MAQRTRIPASVSEQLQPSMAVVCMVPAVLPLEKELTSRSCTAEYVTAATPRPVSTGYGQVLTLAWVPSLWPMYIAVRPSVTAYSQSVRPTTTTPPWNAASAASRSGIIALSPAESHRGGSMASTDCTISSATLSQLSTARPRLVSPAARKLKNGAKSGVHIRTAYWLASFSWHRTAVACGITVTSCSTALTRLCTPSAKLMSSSGYTRMSSGAASELQKARASCATSSPAVRTSSMTGNRLSTPLSGCRQAVPWQKKVMNQAYRFSLRSITRFTSTTASCTTTLTSSIRMGSRPCVASAFRNQVALFQMGRIPRTSRSSICSGRSTVWLTYGPTN